MVAKKSHIQTINTIFLNTIQKQIRNKLIIDLLCIYNIFVILLVD